MLTRTVEQVCVYVLVLNTFGRAEEGAVAAIATDPHKLQEFYESQLLPPDKRYRDEHGMYISFADGPLKYFNPCDSLEIDQTDWYGYGIHSEWIPIEALDQLEARYYMVK